MALICVLILVVAIISSIWPKQEEFFFELGLLGKDKTADAYFTNPNSTIEVGELTTWFIYIYNHMGTAQNVSIRSKLLSSSMELPDDQKHQPSNATTFAEFPLSLSVNQSVLIPFFWAITATDIQNGSVVIKQLSVNNQMVNIDDLRSLDRSFKIVFELWVQNLVYGEYAFAWDSGMGLSSESVNMWFNLSLPSN